MKALKRALIGLATTGLLSVSASAYSDVMTDWYFDADGAGGSAPVPVHSYLDLNGQSFVVNTFTGQTVSFNEVGNFKTNLADSTNDVVPTVTSVFVGSGTGTTGGTLNFTSGTLSIGSGIATFDLISGSGNLEAGTVLPNGAVSLIMQATQMAAGYFFDSSMTDLSTLVGSQLLFGFATTNAEPEGTGQNLLTASAQGATLQSLYNNNFSPDVNNPTIDQLNVLLLGNNGQFKIATVAEPGATALLGIGLLGVFLASRRQRKS